MENNIIATLPTDKHENGKNLSPQKELVKALSAVAFVDGKMREVVCARWYMARKSDGASPVYASVWVPGASVGVSGSGRATGYGYHKNSAALAAALDSAGVVLSEATDGGGDSAVERALEAVARAVAGDSADVLIIKHA